MTNDIVPTTRRRARLTRQGQITVPKAVRDALGARPGDDIEFVGNGQVMLIELRPHRSVLDFAGLAADAADRIPGSPAELDALVDRGLASRAAARARPRSKRSRR